MDIKRVFVIVLDSFGIGSEPDSMDFGDGDTNTLRSICKSPEYDTPNMKKLGMFNIDGAGCGTPEENPIGTFARLRELSRGKDTTIGHWEIAGIVSEKPLPTYPNGFPPEVISDLEKKFGRKILCNKPYSGTQVIKDYGKEQKETGALIVYTSADSVFQIAANEEDVPIEELYKYCKIAREYLQGDHGVGRVIARPYVGNEVDGYTRTPRRHDFSLDPTGDTMLDALRRKGLDTIGVGKISDIFAGRGISRSLGINKDNVDGMNKTLAVMDEDFTGLCFVNLVDFDMQYGHRRDIDGYAKAATVFDKQFGEFMAKMKDDDVVMITADHGCDPGAPGTDHTREYIPLLIYGKQIKEGHNLGTYPTFAMIGATVSDIFGADLVSKGESLLPRILK